MIVMNKQLAPPELVSLARYYNDFYKLGLKKLLFVDDTALPEGAYLEDRKVILLNFSVIPTLIRYYGLHLLETHAALWIVQIMSLIDKVARAQSKEHITDGEAWDFVEKELLRLLGKDSNLFMPTDLKPNEDGYYPMGIIGERYRQALKQYHKEGRSVAREVSALTSGGAIGLDSLEPLLKEPVLLDLQCQVALKKVGIQIGQHQFLTFYEYYVMVCDETDFKPEILEKYKSKREEPMKEFMASQLAQVEIDESKIKHLERTAAAKTEDIIEEEF